MEEIEEMIPVVENYIFQRKGIQVTINPNQFNISDPYLLLQRVSYLNKTFIVAKDWLEANQN